MRCIEDPEIFCGNWCASWRGHRYCQKQYETVVEIGHWKRVWGPKEICWELLFAFKILCDFRLSDCKNSG